MEFSHMTSDVSQTPSSDQPGPWSVVRCGMPCSALLSHSIVNATSAWDSRADRGNGFSWDCWGGARLVGAERRGCLADREPTAAWEPEASEAGAGSGADRGLAGAGSGADRGLAVAMSRPA